MIIKSHKKITDNRLFYMSAQELLLLYIVTLFISKRVNDSNIVKAIVLEWHWSQLGCMPAWHTGRTLSTVAGQKKNILDLFYSFEIIEHIGSMIILISTCCGGSN